MPTETQYTIFEINIQHQPKDKDYYPVIVEFTKPNSEGIVQVKGELRLNKQIQDTLQEFEDWEDTPDKYGKMLGELLFSVGRIRDAWTAAGDRKRILISVDTPELRDLNWERLAYNKSTKWRLVAHNKKTPISINLASSHYVDLPPLQKTEMKALVIVSHPHNIVDEGFATFDETKAVSDAIVALSHITADIDVLAINAQAGVEDARQRAKAQTKITHLGQPTYNALDIALTEKAYTILHIVAHGTHNKNEGEVYIYLADEAGKSELVSAEALVELLELSDKLPRFAFLVSCHSGSLQQRDISDVTTQA